MQGLRYRASHPDIGRHAPRGSARHCWLSLRLRSRRVANDLFFAAIPPHWRHTREELASMTRVPVVRWFQCGYCAWRFDDEGGPRDDLAGVDPRWDPRCESALPSTR